MKIKIDTKNVVVIFFTIILCLLLLIVFLQFYKNDNKNIDILYREGDFSYLLKDNTAVYDGEIVSDKETAIEIAKIVLNNISDFENKKDYNTIIVFYDTEKEIWIVTFDKKDTLGGCVSVAIRKSDAQIVKVWFGE